MFQQVIQASPCFIHNFARSDTILKQANSYDLEHFGRADRKKVWPQLRKLVLDEIFVLCIGHKIIRLKVVTAGVVGVLEPFLMG